MITSVEGLTLGANC